MDTKLSANVNVLEKRVEAKQIIMGLKHVFKEVQSRFHVPALAIHCIKVNG